MRLAKQGGVEQEVAGKGDWESEEAMMLIEQREPNIAGG